MAGGNQQTGEQGSSPFLVNHNGHSFTSLWTPARAVGDGTYVPANAADAGSISMAYVLVKRDDANWYSVYTEQGYYEWPSHGLGSTDADLWLGNAGGFALAKGTLAQRLGQVDGPDHFIWNTGDMIGASTGGVTLAPSKNHALFDTSGRLLVPHEERVDVSGTGVKAVVLPTDRDANIFVVAADNDLIVEVPAGSFDGQKILVNTVLPNTNANTIRRTVIRGSASGNLAVANNDGDNGNEYEFYSGEAISFIWKRGSSAQYRWRPIGSHTFRKEEKLVFAGTPLRNAVIPAGYSRIPMEVLYDPLGRWNSTVNYWPSRGNREYRIEISLINAEGLPAGAFTMIRPNTYAQHALPTATGREFAYNWTGFGGTTGGLGASNTESSLRLLNSTGGDITLVSTMRFIYSRYWRLNVYETRLEAG